jgi:hypothetical protein
MAPKKGTTNNPKGRPPKGRALTEILERAGAKTLTVGGKKVSGKQLAARMAWELVTTGKTAFPDGREIKADFREWFEAVKWIYAQIDGPPKQAHELTGEDGGAIPIHVIEVAGGRAASTGDETRTGIPG